MRNRVLKGELIGSNIHITESRNRSLVGIVGRIVDETRNTLRIRDEKKTRTVMKDQIVFTIEKHGQRYKIDGKKIKGRPEKRIK